MSLIQMDTSHGVIFHVLLSVVTTPSQRGAGRRFIYRNHTESSDITVIARSNTMCNTVLFYQYEFDFKSTLDEKYHLE